MEWNGDGIEIRAQQEANKGLSQEEKQALRKAKKAEKAAQKKGPKPAQPAQPAQPTKKPAQNTQAQNTRRPTQATQPVNSAAADPFYVPTHPAHNP